MKRAVAGALVLALAIALPAQGLTNPPAAGGGASFPVTGLTQVSTSDAPLTFGTDTQYLDYSMTSEWGGSGLLHMTSTSAGANTLLKVLGAPTHTGALFWFGRTDSGKAYTTLSRDSVLTLVSDYEGYANVTLSPFYVAHAETYTGSTKFKFMAGKGEVDSTFHVIWSANSNAINSGKWVGLKPVASGVLGVTNGSTGGGAIDLGDPGTRPTCSVTYRGTIWIDEGAAGVKDDVSICAKDEANAYAWRTLY